MLPKNVLEKMHRLEAAGHECYIVGGAALYNFAYLNMGLTNYKQEPKDYDLFTNCPSNELLEIFPEAKPMGGQDRLNKIFTVITPDQVEISIYRGNGERTETGKTIFDHQSTCDFSMNAIAMSSKGEFILPPDVINHLKQQRLVAMGNPEDRIAEDPNRILRAFRIATKYDLTIENSLYWVLLTTSIASIPKEVIHDELLKILPLGIDQLYISGKLFEIFPRLKEMENITGRGIHHEETCLEHTLETYRQMLHHTTDPILLFTAIVHDWGKVTAYDPDTKKFTGHENIGAKEVKALMQDLKFSNHDIKRVVWLVKNHMKCRNDDDCTKRSRSKWYKFLNRMEDAGVSISDHLTLKYCDSRSRMVTGYWVHEQSLTTLETFTDQDITAQWYNRYIGEHFPQRLKYIDVSGTDLIMLGIPKGPLIGEVLSKLYIMVLAAELPNEKEALINQVAKWQEAKSNIFLN